MAPMSQADGRTGTACACEAEARWDPRRKQSRYGRRGLVGHVDPETGKAVPDGADQGVGPVARLQAGVLRRALPGTWDQVLSLAHHVVCEGSAPLSRFPRYAATHATPYGAPIASKRSSELLASIGEEGRDALCDSLARRHGEGDRLSCDTTSASSRSEALAQVRRGRDEDRVPLPQASLAMLVGHGSGMPPQGRGQRRRRGRGEGAHEGHGPSFAGRVRLAAGRGLRRRRAPTPWRASASSS